MVQKHFVGDGPYRSDPRKVPWWKRCWRFCRSAVHSSVGILIIMGGPALVGFLTGVAVAPERVEVEVTPECPEPEEPELSFRERGCIALCANSGDVAWFARDGSYSYMCQCGEGPIVNHRATEGLW